MRVLICLTYYRPHYSGLTIYTERLARALVMRGHQVTVLTSRFNRDLPAREIQDGVEIIRPDVMFRISKGVIMPAFPLWALRLVQKADIVNLHLPQLDASYLAILGRIFRRKVVVTYHCDLRLPSGPVHWLANQASNFANLISATAANVIVTNTGDYARSSDFLKQFLHKVEVIPPPIEIADFTEEQKAEFIKRWNIDPGDQIIGMVARLASEKGVEYLVEAMPEVLQKHPRARVIFLGQYQNVLGEEHYAQKLDPLIRALGDRWTFLGNTSEAEKAVFFNLCRLTLLPSINSTDSFGIVQIESMMAGTPVIGSDLPGVRIPVQSTGMGLVTPPRDSSALARAICEILDQPEKFQGDAQRVRQRYSLETISAEYESVFKKKSSGSTPVQG